jgi:hypothetical protein
VNRDLLVWIPVERQGFVPCSEQFLTRLQRAWIEHFQTPTGLNVPVIDTLDPSELDRMRNLSRDSRCDARTAEGTELDHRHVDFQSRADF